MADRVSFYIPPGRIVAGSPTFKQDKDMQGRPKENPNWFLAIAVPKTDPNVVTTINTIIQTAMSGNAGNQTTMQRIQASLANGNFDPHVPGAYRWKIADGDKENSSREGYAGCWIFKLSTILGVINCCDSNNQAIDPNMVKTGFYVDAIANAQINGLNDAPGAATVTAGIYLNPVMVRLLGYGPEIQVGPSAEQLFANTPAVLPQGASAQPVAPASKPGGFGVQQPQNGFGGQPAAPTGGFGGHAGPAGPTTYNASQPPAAPGFTQLQGFGAAPGAGQ